MSSKKQLVVTRKDITNMAMTTGNEKKFQKVIHNGMIKQWVGIGWVTERHARPEELNKYPIVK